MTEYINRAFDTRETEGAIGGEIEVPNFNARPLECLSHTSAWEHKLYMYILSETA